MTHVIDDIGGWAVELPVLAGRPKQLCLTGIWSFEFKKYVITKTLVRRPGCPGTFCRFK